MVCRSHADMLVLGGDIQLIDADGKLTLERRVKGNEETACTATGAETVVDRFGDIAVKKAFCTAASAIEQGDLLRAGMLTDAVVCWRMLAYADVCASATEQGDLRDMQ